MDNLKYGSRGTDVELLQLALTRSGYYNSPYGIDGIFGADTQNAVRRFQAVSYTHLTLPTIYSV